jgi:cyanophycinase
MGYLLLEGGAEFGGQMSLPDQKAIKLAGGPDAPIRIIPTAAAPDKNHIRAGYNGVRWFQSLGARDVKSLALTDKASVEDHKIAAELKAAKLIYLLGGFPDYLAKTLKFSLAWESVLEAYQDGAVIAGSSAGAMVLCQFYYDPATGQVCDGLNLVRNACVLPHHNTFGKGWAARLLSELPGVTLLGIDESTGLLDDGSGENWAVSGGGTVTLYQGNQIAVSRAGESIVMR